MPLSMIKPLNSNVLYRSFGVNALANHLKTNYRHSREWVDALAECRATYFRSLYSPGLPATQQVVSYAREARIKWGMQVSTLTSTPHEIAATIDHMAQRAADRCHFLEGTNEPDWIRGTGPAPDSWYERTVRQQRAIFEAARAHPNLSEKIPVLGPSLRDESATEADYARLASLGILDYMTHAPIHRYPNGRYPDHLLDERIAMLSRVWPGRPVWITETGYHTATNDPSGHRPVPEAVMADYIPSAFLEAADRGVPICWFELLDQPDPGKVEREHNFGLYATLKGDGPPWRAKPAARAIAQLMDSLADPGPGYNTARVALEVRTEAPDVRVTVVGKRSGEVTAYVRRAADCWDAKRQRAIRVTPASVVLETSSGATEVLVSHKVQRVPLYPATAR